MSVFYPDCDLVARYRLLKWTITKVLPVLFACACAPHFHFRFLQPPLCLPEWGNNLSFSLYSCDRIVIKCYVTLHCILMLCLYVLYCSQVCLSWLLLVTSILFIVYPTSPVVGCVFKKLHNTSGVVRFGAFYWSRLWFLRT